MRPLRWPRYGEAVKVVKGDFDWDGQVDLAIFNHDSSSVSILLGFAKKPK
jgi:hypothetical protein